MKDIMAKCCTRAKDLLFWPGMNSEICEMVQKCETCQRFQNRQPKEPVSTKATETPWYKLGIDLFQINNVNFLVVVDYFSNYPEVFSLDNTLSSTIITKMKSVMSRHGIPMEVICDGGPQFSSQEFLKFSQDWDFSYRLSSPYYPKGNTQAERTVQTMKKTYQKGNGLRQ